MDRVNDQRVPIGLECPYVCAGMNGREQDESERVNRFKWRLQRLEVVTAMASIPSHAKAILGTKDVPGGREREEE